MEKKKGEIIKLTDPRHPNYKKPGTKPVTRMEDMKPGVKPPERRPAPAPKKPEGKFSSILSSAVGAVKKAAAPLTGAADDVIDAQKAKLKQANDEYNKARKKKIDGEVDKATGGKK